MLVESLLPIVLAVPARDAIAAAIGEERAAPAVTSEALKGDWDQATGLLSKAEAAHAAGRDLLALERLTLARIHLDPLRAVAADRVETIPDDLRREIARASSPALPAAVRALRDDARVQAPILAKTTAMWRENGESMGATYYAAQGVAFARAAAFDANLQYPKPGTAPKIVPLAPVVDALEGALVRAYVPPVSKDRHREFILASSAVKTSRDLLAAGSAEGALYEILRARLLGAPILRAGVPLRELDALRETAVSWRKRLAAADHDASLALLFLEKAEAMLDDAATSEEAHGHAATILDDVLPEYIRRVGPDAAAVVSAPHPRPPAGAEATVTLVRWPYT